MSTLLFWYGGWGFVIPRIILGAMLIAHGWPKIKDLKQTARNFDGMGFKPGNIWGTVAAFLEFFGGIGIVIGMWVPYISFLLAGQFVVIIIWKLSKKMPFISGWEIDALVLALVIMFFTLYGGFYLF
jgi:putative oxidoreductase